MLVIALTGGIGSGKSAVSKRFEALDVPVIDSDIIAREQVMPGSPALCEIENLFGPRIIREDGSLNRAKLRDLVFNEPAQRRQLEQILHPRIRQAMEHRLRALDAPYAVLVIPLLFESGLDVLADRVLVVDCPQEQQIARIRQRDDLDESQIKQILAAQTDRSTRLSRADDVIDNRGSLAELTEATDRLHRFYLQLSQAAR